MAQTQNRRFWLLASLAYFILNFLGIIVSRIIVKTDLSVRIIFSTMILSLIVAIIPSIAGYFGRQLFVILYSCANVIAIAYMLYIVLSNATDGWGDLTSILSYFVFLIIGFFIALVVEIIFIIYKRLYNTSK